MTPIILTWSEVLMNCKDYYARGKLTAQHPVRTKRECTNEIKDEEEVYRCAVSASFPKDWEHMYSFGSITNGIRMGYISVEDKFDLAKMVQLQSLHDYWAIAAKTDPESQITKDIHDKFAMIMSEETVYA